MNISCDICNICVNIYIYIHTHIFTLINHRMNGVGGSSPGGGMVTSQGHKY